MRSCRSTVSNPIAIANVASPARSNSAAIVGASTSNPTSAVCSISRTTSPGSPARVGIYVDLADPRMSTDLAPDLQQQPVRVGRTNPPVRRILRATTGVDERAPELLARRRRLVHLEREREEPLAARREKHAGRLRVVVRLEHLEDAVLPAQHDLARAEARDIDRVLVPLEPERALVDGDRAVEAADDEDEAGEARHGISFSARVR